MGSMRVILVVENVVMNLSFSLVLSSLSVPKKSEISHAILAASKSLPCLDLHKSYSFKPTEEEN